MKLFDRLFAKPARDVEAELAAALAAKMALAEQLANVSHSRDAWRAECLNRNAALDAIGATESRNGTAQRLARMAREARE